MMKKDIIPARPKPKVQVPVFRKGPSRPQTQSIQLMSISRKLPPNNKKHIGFATGIGNIGVENRGKISGLGPGQPTKSILKKSPQDYAPKKFDQVFSPDLPLPPRSVSVSMPRKMTLDFGDDKSMLGFKTSSSDTKLKLPSYGNKVKGSPSQKTKGAGFGFGTGDSFSAGLNRKRNELKQVGFDEHKKQFSGDVGLRANPKFYLPKLGAAGRAEDEEEEFDAKHRAELRSILKSKPKDEKSFAAIQRKLEETKEEWRNLKTGVDIGNKGKYIGAGASDRFSAAGTGRFRIEHPSPESATKNVVNAHLAEISRQFRESLKLRPDQKKGKKFQSKESSLNLIQAKHLLDSARESLDSFKTEQEKFAEQNKHLILGRPGSKFAPKQRGNVKGQKQKPGSSKGLDFAGVVKLRSLLEANSSELFANKVKEGPEQMDSHRRAVDPKYPHEPLDKFIGSPRNADPFVEMRKVMKEKMDKELELEINSARVASAKRNNQMATMTKATGMGKTKTSVDAQTSARPFPEQKIATEMVHGKIGESVKTLDEAAKVANSLGSLMTRVAATRTDKAAETQQENYRPQFQSPMSALANNIGMLGAQWGQNHIQTGTGTGTQTGVQTSTPAATTYYSMKPPSAARIPMPEIKFKKDMSEVDQRRLQELRAKKHEWEAQAIQMQQQHQQSLKY